MFPFDFEKPKTMGEWVISIAATGIVLSSPYGAKGIISEIKRRLARQRHIKLDEINSRTLSQALYYCKKRKIVKFMEKGGKTHMVLTEKGKKRQLSFEWENMIIRKPASWDGKWRIVMFDFPEKDRGFRDVFRDKLKKLGLLQFQKSVWVYPYECEDEIDFVAERWGVAKYLTLLTVQIDNDFSLRTNFRI